MRAAALARWAAWANEKSEASQRESVVGWTPAARAAWPKVRPAWMAATMAALAAGRRFADQRWRVVRVPHQTEADAGWEVKAVRVRFRRDERPTAGSAG